MIRRELTTSLTLEAGGVLPLARVVYHTSQEAWDGRQPVIWICHALTANSDPEDWWPEMVGPGKAIDTDKCFVACVNMLGSAYGSEGPTRVNPATGKPWLLDFPKVTVRDIIHATIEVRKALKIKQVDLLVGSSIGGFQALEWAIQEPEVIKRAAFMATSARVTPYLAATEESQRMALEALFGGHPYGKPQGGLLEEVEALTRTDAAAYHERMAVPGMTKKIVQKPWTDDLTKDQAGMIKKITDAE